MAILSMNLGCPRNGIYEYTSFILGEQTCWGSLVQSGPQILTQDQLIYWPVA